MTEAINSLKFFKIHTFLWKFLGAAHKQTKKSKWRMPYLAFTISMNILVTFGYPFHLGMSVFRNNNMTDDIKNLTTFVTCGACSIKFAFYIFNYDKVAKMEKLLKLLDARVTSEKEHIIYKSLGKQLVMILLTFVCIYTPVAIFAEAAFLTQEERGLIYPAWFPLDWHNSTCNYYIANVYQIAGVSYQIQQNYVSDCYPAVMLCLISGNIRMLGIRFEHLGKDENISMDAHEKELEACITDHKYLLELFKTIESFMSMPMLVQFTVTAVNVCISIAALLFFVTEPMAKTYFFFYGLAMPLQIFPTCYFGMDAEYRFDQIHYAAFSCNWITQRRSFKQKLMIFVEGSLRKSTAMAGGMLRVHMDTFFSTLKFAYSLFTVILGMGN
ncbi:odorant receptor 59a-like [Scaptodrosophila lebanonensis]|uniref:Odorant receptor n=1 Tax=Drosophila lebanonensis TaxID=7225 RepID=A0A6J2UJ02_DROLE|nr:odorant receptor 59a-like [Scaptodrosophila lebanonensis]